MSGTTTNLGLTTPDMTDTPSQTIPALKTNFQIIDNQIGILSGKIRNPKDLKYGAIGDNQSHPITQDQANYYNTNFFINAVAGDEQDWCAIQSAINDACMNFGVVYLSTGTYHTNKELTVKWTASPQTGLPSTPNIEGIYGDGWNSTIVANIADAGRGALEWLGESMPYSATGFLRDFAITVNGGSNQSYALRLGDANHVECDHLQLQGANALMLKIGGSSSYAQINTNFKDCRFVGNYGNLFWSNDNLAQCYAVNYESGGAIMDNVRFESCFFYAMVVPRGSQFQFDNCQFSVNPNRPAPYCNPIFLTVGNMSARDCYFEDYVDAVHIDAGTWYVGSCILDNCRFSGKSNYQVGGNTYYGNAIVNIINDTNYPTDTSVKITNPLISKHSTGRIIQNAGQSTVVVLENPIPINDIAPYFPFDVAQDAEYVGYTHRDMTIYVNPVTGSDTANNGLTSSTAFATLGRALRSLPTTINHNITIQLSSGTFNEDINIRPFTGKGRVKIVGAGNLAGSTGFTFGNLNVYGNTMGLFGYGTDGDTFSLMLTGIRLTGTMSVYNGSVKLTNSTLDGSTYTGVYVEKHSLAYLDTVAISNKSSIAIYATYGGRVVTANMSGTGNNQGLYASRGGIIQKVDSTVPTSTTAETNVGGGFIVGSSGAKLGTN